MFDRTIERASDYKRSTALFACLVLSILGVGCPDEEGVAGGSCITSGDSCDSDSTQSNGGCCSGLDCEYEVSQTQFICQND